MARKPKKQWTASEKKNLHAAAQDAWRRLEKGEVSWDHVDEAVRQARRYIGLPDTHEVFSNIIGRLRHLPEWYAREHRLEREKEAAERRKQDAKEAEEILQAEREAEQLQDMLDRLREYEAMGDDISYDDSVEGYEDEAGETHFRMKR